MVQPIPRSTGLWRDEKRSPHAPLGSTGFEMRSSLLASSPRAWPSSRQPHRDEGNDAVGQLIREDPALVSLHAAADGCKVCEAQRPPRQAGTRTRCHDDGTVPNRWDEPSEPTTVMNDAVDVRCRCSHANGQGDRPVPVRRRSPHVRPSSQPSWCDRLAAVGASRRWTVEPAHP